MMTIEMNRFFFPLFVLAFAIGTTTGSAPGQSIDSTFIQFVESVPIETMLDNPDIPDARVVWKEMIDGARTSLDIEQFYISNKVGEPLEDILASIVGAARRGVAVRLIVDARMYRTYPESVDSLGKTTNIQSRIIDYGKLAGGIQHAKYFIVDGKEIFLGSQNFDWRALKHIHELGLRMRHPELVNVYRDIFDLDWQLAEKNDRAEIPRLLTMRRHAVPFPILVRPNDTAWVTPTMSPKGLLTDSLSWDEENIVRLIDGAHHDVDLQFLSYSTVGRDKSPYPPLENALKRAAGRGVKVRMIIADWEKATPSEEYLKSLSGTTNCEVRFSVIPDWSGGYVPFGRVEHCKYICVDGAAFWLGTSNAEKSYFVTSRNLGIVVRSPSLASRLQSIFLKGWNGSYMEEIRPDKHFTPRRHGEN